MAGRRGTAGATLPQMHPGHGRIRGLAGGFSMIEPRDAGPKPGGRPEGLTPLDRPGPERQFRQVPAVRSQPDCGLKKAGYARRIAEVCGGAAWTPDR